MVGKRLECLMMLQIHRSDTPTLMQLLTDLPPLRHGDLTFWYEHMHVPVYTVQYNRQFRKYRRFKCTIPWLIIHAVLAVFVVDIFLERTVNVWNFLPSSVNFSTLDAFKRSIVSEDFPHLWSVIQVSSYSHVSTAAISDIIVLAALLVLFRCTCYFPKF